MYIVFAQTFFSATKLQDSISNFTAFFVLLLLFITKNRRQVTYIS